MKCILKKVSWRMYNGEGVFKRAFWKVYAEEVYTEEGIMENL